MKTLVIIDNDALARSLLAECVSGRGWRVLEAENGEAGLDLVLRHNPAAVICDLRTPKGNGFKVCRLIREHAHLKSTRVILTSVSRFANDRDTALAAGADVYLTKPLQPTELLKALDVTHHDEEPPKVEAPVLEPFDGPTRLRFWGVRGSIPTPGQDTATFGGNTSCVEVRVGSHVIVLDAGSGIRKLGLALTKEFGKNPLDVTMLITHTHWDHIQGFPFFIPAYNPRVNVRILGFAGAVHGLRSALFEQMQSAFFPVGLNQMASRITFQELDDMEFQLGPIKVTAHFANHPGICLGYRLGTPHGDIVYMPDHEVYERHERERQKAAGESSLAAIDYARQQDRKTIDFVRNADILIADSQYDETEYPSRLGWGHTCVDDTVANAIRADVRHLFLFHHDPDHRDDKLHAMVEGARAQVAEAGSTMLVTGASEGTDLLIEGAQTAGAK